MTAHPNHPVRGSGAPFFAHRLESDGGSHISRRSALTGALLASAAAVTHLAGCAPEPHATGGTGRVTSDPLDAAEYESAPHLAESPELEQVVEAAPAMPDVEAIIAAHEGRQPVAWGVDIPGVVRTAAEAGLPGLQEVYLTLDACGGPAGSGVDQALIDGLRAASVPALLFVNLRWITAHPALAAELAADPLFRLGNHGTQHLPLSVTGASAYGIPGTRNVREALNEVWDNHVALTELTGTAPQWFRPGTAHLDDVALSVVEALGERVLGFSVNGDAGATFPAATVAAEVGHAPAGAVVIAHFNQPGSGTSAGILEAIGTVRARGLNFGSW